MTDKSSYRKKYESLAKAFRLKSERLRFLSEVVRTANSLLEPEAVISYIMERIQLLVYSEAWSLLLLDESGKYLVFTKALGVNADALKDKKLGLGEGIAGHVGATGRPMMVNNVRASSYFNPDMDNVSGFVTHSVLCVPLRSRGKTLGVIEVINKSDKGDFSEEDLDTVTLFAEPVAVALENAYLFQRVRRMTLVDDLTKLYNSRYLHQALEIEITRGRRYNYPVAVIFMDLDSFKQVNDRFGHLVGSETLKVVGSLLKDVVRNVDIIARYGGDEFTLILPNTDSSGALLVAGRLLREIVGHDYGESPGYPFSLSASFGIASFPDHGDNPEELIQKADQAMYRVKESTKNDCAIFA